MAKHLYPIGTPVYQRVCQENVGMVTAHIIRSNHSTYLVTWSNLEEHEHQEFELTTERDYRANES